MKRLKYLFIFPLLLAPLFFSVNVSAITFTTEISPTGNVYSNTGLSCQYLYNTPSPQLWYCPITQLTSSGLNDFLSSVSTTNTIHTVAGNYYSAIVTIRSQNQPKPMLWSINTSPNFSVAAINKIEDDSLGNEYFLNYASGNGAITGTSESYSYSVFYEVILRAYYTGDFNWTFGYNGNIFWTKYLDLSSVNNVLYLSSVSEYSAVDNSSVVNAINSQSQQQHQDSQAEINSQNATTDAIEEQNRKDNQDRQDVQNQQSQASSDSSDSAAAISSASDSLLIVMGNFINIVTHPPARDCTIDGDMGHMDLGQIDLCQLSPPPAIQTIATLLVIGFIIPFAYGVISTILNLLKGATQ